MAALKIVSFSELQTIRKCPLKHQLSYVERWTSEKEPMSALSKGTAWHLVMETHYRKLQELQRLDTARHTGFALSECREVVEQVIESEILPIGDELADLVWWMYVGYVEYYGTDPEWKILAVEHAAQCRLPTQSGRASNFVLKMKIDLVVGRTTARGKQQILVVDHKSAKDLSREKELDLDDQFGLYTWGMRQLGKKVFGQVHNGARTLRLKGDEELWTSKYLGTYPEEGATPYVPGDSQALDKRFVRTDTYRTDVELDNIAQEAYAVVRNRYAEQARLTRLGKDSPRHPDPRDCRWMCDYVDACLMGRKTDGHQMREFLRAKGLRQDYDRH